MVDMSTYSDPDQISPGSHLDDFGNSSTPYPSLGREFPHRDAICTKCGEAKRPTRAYLALLKSRDLPYICQACRQAAQAPAMDLGKLGAI